MLKKLLLVRVLPLVLFFLNPQINFGQACPTGISVESNPGTTICEGEKIEFTANPTGGTNLTYQWKVNGAIYGRGAKISIPGLKNEDKVRV